MSDIAKITKKYILVWLIEDFYALKVKDILYLVYSSVWFIVSAIFTMAIQDTDFTHFEIKGHGKKLSLSKKCQGHL